MNNEKVDSVLGNNVDRQIVVGALSLLPTVIISINIAKRLS